MRAINQVVLPLNIGYKIPDNDPVVLLSELCEVLDFEDYLSCLSNSWYR